MAYFMKLFIDYYLVIILIRAPLDLEDGLNRVLLYR